MSATVFWTPEAKKDRNDIWDYISVGNPIAAVRMDKIFSDAADRLSTQPQMGKVGRISGTREILPHESYRLVYEIDQNTVWVLAIVSTARQWPPVKKL